METVPVRDWMALSVGLVGLIVGQLQARDRLPGWARRWLGQLGRDRIEQVIGEAAKMADLSPDARRIWVVRRLAELAERELGLTLPESVGNLLVEYVYQIWKRRR
jgi:hypothetical protein